MHRNPRQNYRPTMKITNHAAKNRDLGQALGGAIFGCTNETYKECTTGFVFGLPASNWHWVQHVQTGMPIFLFNYNDKMMHGIFRAVLPGSQNINPQGWTSITHTSVTRYPAQVKVEWFERCRPIVDRDFKRAIEGAFFTDKQFTYQLTKDEARRLCEMFSKAATKRLYEGTASGPPSKAVRQNSQPSASDPPAAPQPPEAPPRKRPSPSSSTGSSELRRAAQEPQFNAVDGWDPEPPSSADAVVNQAPLTSGRATQHDPPADPWQASEPPANAWQTNGKAHRGSIAAQYRQAGQLPNQDNQQHPQQGQQQQQQPPYRPDSAEHQSAAAGSQQNGELNAAGVPPLQSEAQQRVKAYRSSEGLQQVKPYRPDSADNNVPHVPHTQPAAEYSPPDVSPEQPAPEYRPPAVSPERPVPEHRPPAVSPERPVPEYRPPAGSPEQPVFEYRPPAVSPEPPIPEYRPPATISTHADNSNAEPSAAQNGSAAASQSAEEAGQPTADPNDDGEQLATAASQIAANLEDDTDDMPQAPGHAESQPSADRAKEHQTQKQEVSGRITQDNGESSTAGQQPPEQLSAEDEKERGSDRGAAAAPAGPSDTHTHRHTGSDGEDGPASEDVHMLGSTPPSTSGIQPVAAAIHQLTASQQAAKIYLLGGGTCKQDSMWLDAVDVYDPSSQSCTPAAPLPKPCAYGAAATIGQRLFYVGGGNGKDWFNSTLRLSLTDDTWEPMADMHEGRGSLFTAMQGYLLWAIGGRNKFAFHNTTECYHPAHDQWVMGPKMSRRRFAAAGGVLNNAVFVTGGFDGQAYTSSCEKLDPREGKWSLVGSMLTRRGSHACAVQDGQLYAFGGWAAQHPLKECEVYEARVDRWRAAASMHEARAYFAGVACQGSLYAMGGLSPAQSSAPVYKTTLESYNPKNDSWSVVVPPAKFLLERAFMSACVVSQV